jgi:hypothetical protein
MARRRPQRGKFRVAPLYFNVRLRGSRCPRFLRLSDSLRSLVGDPVPEIAPVDRETASEGSTVRARVETAVAVSTGPGRRAAEPGFVIGQHSITPLVSSAPGSSRAMPANEVQRPG